MTKKIIIIFTLLLLVCPCLRAEEFALRGTVRDRATNSYLPGAAFTVYDEKGDSVFGGSATSYDYNSSMAIPKSEFTAKVPRREGVFSFVFTYEGFDTLRFDYRLAEMGRRESGRSIGLYYMDRHREPVMLNEVTVETSKVKFYHNGDTLVFNADAFNLAEGSMLDALIKQLPGVDVRDGGRIFVNGRYVESLLLNGKDFFKGNNRVMLDNLAAYTVKNIQVYEKQSEEARFLRQEMPEDNEYVMDVKLKKEFNSGWMLNAEGGYGTENTSLGRLFAMNYSAQSRISFIANANNLGIDSRPTQDSSVEQWQLGKSGRTKFFETGFDYNVESADAKRKFIGNAYAKTSTFDLASVGSRVNYMPGGNNYTYSRSTSQNKQLRISTWHRFSHESEYNYVQVSPYYSFTRNENSSLGASALYNAEIATHQWNATLDSLISGKVSAHMRDSLINQSRTMNYGKEYAGTGFLAAEGNLRFAKSPDWIHYEAQGNLSHRHSHRLTEYLIGYGDPSQQGIAERQRRNNRPDYNANWSAKVSYNYVFNNKSRLNFTYSYYEEWKKSNSSLYTAKIKADATGRFDLLALETMQGDLDAQNSYKSSEHNAAHSISSTLILRLSKRGNITLSIPMEVKTDRLHYIRGTVDANPRRTAVVFSGSPASLYLTNGQGNEVTTQIMAHYNVNASLPSLESTIDMVNDADPLNVFLGNPHLKTGYSHVFDFSINKYSKNRRGAYVATSLSLIGGVTTNSLVYGYSLDPATGVRTYKTYNANGNWNASAMAYIASQFGKKNRWSYDANISFSYHRYSDMIGTSDGSAPSAFKVDSYNTRGEASLAYDFGHLTTGVKCAADWTHAAASASGPNTAYIRPSIEIKGTIFGPLSIETSCAMLKRIGYADKTLNTADWIWNATLTCTIGKNWKLMADGFDILGRLSSVITSINSQGRSETHYNTLPRYTMLRCQYAVSIAPKKKLASIPESW